MAQSNDFLPFFDVAKIESYFFRDYNSIYDFFKIISENIDEDLKNIANAYSKKDMKALKNAIHTIKPIFGISGLPLIQQEVDKFYILCKQYNTMQRLMKPYHQLWTQLQLAKEMITAQHLIFEGHKL